MTIDYPEDKKLELWVKDSGVFDGFALFVNGSLVMEVGDQKTHKIPLARPAESAAIVLHFGGVDGGKSAIIDVTDEKKPEKLADSEGLKHSYIIVRA